MEAATARSRKRKSAVVAHGPKPSPEERSAPHDPPPAGATEGDTGGVDHISALPDAVLGEIITLLPTKDGARTQILSPRWRHIWRSAPLNLDCRGLLNHRNKLPGVVSSILSSHPGPGRRLCLSYYTTDHKAIVDACLQSPALDNLQELDFYYHRPPEPLPSSTFRFSSTLCVAHIRQCSILDVTVQGLHFPLLKQLRLDSVTISECSLHSLIGGCPVLESLMMKVCLGFRCLRINSLTIRGIGFHKYSCREHNNVELNELIIDNAPCLERLLLYVTAGLDILVVAAPKLHTIGFLSDAGYRSNSFNDHLNRLVFGSTVIQGLRVNKLAMVMHTVKILAVQMKALSLDAVIELLTCFPCSEKLYIRASKSESNNLWRRKHHNLIKCLDISLKAIELKSYCGVKSQVNFVTFFVLNARKLELMTIEVDSKHYSKEFLAEQHMKLQLENRASRDAQFNFTAQRFASLSWNMKHVRDLEIDPFE